MKLRVDSGEFTRAVSAARKFTRDGTGDVKSQIALEAVGDRLFVYSTTLTANFRARVNAFDVEPGICTVLARDLDSITYDSGDMIEIVVEKKLQIKYARTKPKIDVACNDMDEFPNLIDDMPEVIRIDSNAILAVAGASDPSSSLPIATAINIIPHTTGKIQIFAVDGLVGTLTHANGSISKHLAMSCDAIRAGLSVMDERVSIRAKGNHVSIEDDTKIVVFPVVSLPVNTDKISELAEELFYSPTISTDSGIVVGSETMGEIVRMCKMASSIDPASQIALSGNGNLFVEIAGDGIEDRATFPQSGNLTRTVLFCKTFLRLLAPTKNEQYEIFLQDGERRAIIFGDSDKLKSRYVMSCSTGGRLGTEHIAVSNE